MLKKFLLILFLMFFSICFAAEIPKNKQAQYKMEIETFVSKEYPKIKKRVDTEFWHAKNRYHLYELYKYTIDKNKYLDDMSNHLLNVKTEEFYFYLHLIDITDKYVKIKDDMPPTDFSVYLYEFIYPYLKNNNINMKKIDEIILYIDEKQTKIEKFVEEAG